MNRHPQAGSTLIEVLVAVLLLSFGILALAAMLSFAVQMPKLADYRATAAKLAAGHVERMRANPGGFTGGATGGFDSGDYDTPSSYDGSFSDIALADCAYPKCTPASLAAMDNAFTQQAARMALPAGGMLMQRDRTSGTASASIGNLWIIWQEPSTYAALNPSSSDNCPPEVTGTYTDPKPRCLYVRFKL